MLEINSTVYRHLANETISQVFTFETTHLKQLPFNTFFIHTNFELRAFRIGPYRNLKQLTDETHEFMTQDGSTFHNRRKHISHCYPKEPLVFPPNFANII